MKKLIDIYDQFLSSDNKLVLGGTNSELDFFSKEKIREIITKNVILKQRGKKDLILTVLDIDVAMSLIGKKNIFIKIDEAIMPEEIGKNSKIYIE